MRATFLLLSVFAVSAAAQPVSVGWKPAFERLSRCVDQLAPAQRSQLESVMADLNKGLSGGFARPGAEKPPVPASYAMSLTDAALLCEYARVRGVRYDSSNVLRDLRRDLEIKVQDCRDNGWYRNVPVEVKTLKDGKESPGWEIYYEWLPGKYIRKPQAVRYKTLSPSSEELPPGLYSFQARKAGSQSTETPVAVVSNKKEVTCEIPVP